MERVRRASAVVLTRGSAEALEVYLVERSPALRFYGGYWAFPGGVVDHVLDADALEHRERRGKASQLAPAADEAAWARRHARCACRELFEETGVLLGPSAPQLDARERAALRRELLDDEAEHVLPRWREACSRAELEPELAPAFARVLTPPFAPTRYDTSFHHVHHPAGEEPSVDGMEAVAGAFFRPAELLARWRLGELFVVPPTLYLLEHLVEHGLERGLVAAGRACVEIAAGRLFGACQSPGILVAPLATPTVPPATTTNAFLVGGAETYVVDPATYDEGERERLFRLCDEVEAEGRRIAGVLLTHHHHDHVGSAAALARRYGVAVSAHPETLARLSLDGLATKALHDGDELALGTAPDGSSAWRLRALFTPGHAPGHLAFVESYLRGAIVGDLVSTLSTIVIDPPEGHMATYLASLQRLIEAEIRVLHPAHGLPTRDGVAVVRGYLAHRAARERKLLAALGTMPRAPRELVPGVYDDTPVAMHALAERSLQAGLEKLREEGRAECSQAGWTLTSEG